MNWKIKLLAQKLLDVLPSDFGLQLHFGMQQRFGNVGRMNSEKRLINLKRGIGTAKYLQEKVGYNFDGCKVLEIGTGWHGADLLWVSP